ncbi:glutamate--cysteine ligase [Citrobacter koseri]|nr:glutamate--cysteine ligase [Citrobacter koseri]
MIPDVSQALTWLERHPQALKGIQRGLERETLRVNADGTLATTGHPDALGSALTHKWVTTDFAEALLEFITPVDGDIQHMLTLMRDLHRYTARNLGDERMWPLSMPCYIAEGQDIELAQYGTSNIGRLKTLYREGVEKPLRRVDANHLRRTLQFFAADGILAGEVWRRGRGRCERENFRRLFPPDP